MKILMAGSLPLAAPWNGADKNLARLLVRVDPENTFLVQTGPADEWPDHVIAVRSVETAALPTRGQKARAFAFLLGHAARADVIHVVASLHAPSPWTARLLRLAARVARRPLVHTVPSTGDSNVTRGHFPGDITVVVSAHTRARLEAAGVPRVVQVAPPLEVDALGPATPPSTIAAELRLGERAVLYPAHYGPDSGLREILAAFAGLPAAYADTVLVLACRAHPWQDADREAAQLQARAAELGIADRVRVLGFVPDMAALMSACALTVLVPRKLAAKMDLPLVILESLALQRPVIVSDAPPISEALLGGAGCAVPFGNVGRLTDALAELLHDAEMRARLGAAGRAAVLARCDPVAVVQQYRSIYRAAVARASVVFEAV